MVSFANAPAHADLHRILRAYLMQRIWNDRARRHGTGCR